MNAKIILEKAIRYAKDHDHFDFTGSNGKVEEMTFHVAGGCVYSCSFWLFSPSLHSSAFKINIVEGR